MAIKLGQKVKDPITGFKGIAVCRMDWLTGCTRIGVQAPVGKDGKVIPVEYFDEPQLEKIKVKSKKGGPRPSPQKPSGPQR
jgi:hypothetical protein